MAANTISLVEKRNQRKGKVITILVHLGLLLLVLFPFLNYETPDPEPAQFVVIDFKDEFKSAAEKSSTKKAAPTKGVEKKVAKKPTPQKKVAKKPKPKPVAKKKPVLTTNKKEKPIRTKPTKAKKEVEVPQKDPTPHVPEPTVKEEVEEEATDAPTENTAKEQPTDKTDGGAKDIGQSEGNGEGQSGSSTTGNSKNDGVANQGNNGMDFSGDGIFNRKVIYRADVKKITKEEGKIVVNLCINQDGRVVYAKLNDDLSTIETPSVLRKAIRVATDYRFERDRSAPRKQCGKLTFLFEIEEEE
ncbi:MAG: hypothetical protein AAGD05_14280 [Bacteroidota bacterium]